MKTIILSITLLICYLSATALCQAAWFPFNFGTFPFTNNLATTGLAANAAATTAATGANAAATGAATNAATNWFPYNFNNGFFANNAFPFINSANNLAATAVTFNPTTFFNGGAFMNGFNAAAIAGNAIPNGFFATTAFPTGAGGFNNINNLGFNNIGNFGFPAFGGNAGFASPFLFGASPFLKVRPASEGVGYEAEYNFPGGHMKSNYVSSQQRIAL
ncbi:hypothetical protein ABK040_015185 [Willaertia magna]